MHQKVRHIIGRNNLNTLGNHMIHCGEAFSMRESKYFVSGQGDKKFLIDVDFMDIILKISAITFSQV